MPLIEIVTEPALSSGEEAYAFLTELRKLLRYLEICDGNMEEGSMRCDANISIRKKGISTLGTKVEVKNLNSMRNVKKAIEYETRRMIELVENGESIIQQTRSFDASTGTTFSFAQKKRRMITAILQTLILRRFLLRMKWLKISGKHLPALPEERVQRYTHRIAIVGI